MSGPPAALPLPPSSTLPVLPLHLGDLHAVEQLLVVVLAFGPFLVLGVVVAVLRRRDLASEEPADDDRPAQRER